MAAPLIAAAFCSSIVAGAGPPSSQCNKKCWDAMDCDWVGGGGCDSCTAVVPDQGICVRSTPAPPGEQCGAVCNGEYSCCDGTDGGECKKKTGLQVICSVCNIAYGAGTGSCVPAHKTKNNEACGVACNGDESCGGLCPVCDGDGYMSYCVIARGAAPAPLPRGTPPRVAAADGKCCETCAAPLEKYYSVDVAHGFCGEACIDPSKFNVYKVFEKNLTKAADDTPCSEQFTPTGTHYTLYNGTVTHGVPGLLSVTLDLYAPGPTVRAR